MRIRTFGPCRLAAGFAQQADGRDVVEVVEVDDGVVAGGDAGVPAVADEVVGQLVVDVEGAGVGGQDVVADGPMFKSYRVEGNKLIVSFEHAEGGLVVGETGTNSKNVVS